MKGVYIIGSDAPDEIYRTAASSVTVSEWPYMEEADMHAKDEASDCIFFFFSCQKNYVYSVSTNQLSS